ncbi:MAG: hypothetical protein AAGE52_12115 [Myxococcota bacterium]
MKFATGRARGDALRVGVAALLLGSCVGEFDETRVCIERGTLGEEIYQVFCERLAATELPNDVSGRESRAVCAGEAPEGPTPRLTAMAQNRDRLVAALDQVLPEPIEDDLDHFTLQLIPFYDPPAESLPEQTRAIGTLLADVAMDEEAVAALERLSTRAGYRPLRLALGVARPVLAYPEIVDFTDVALDTIDEGGSAGEEWDMLLKTLAIELATANEGAPEDGPSTLELTRDLLFRTRTEFGSGPRRLMAIRDRRGIAIPASADGSVPPPFADMNGDGLADVDVLGRYLDSSGGLIDVGAPFAFLGEADIPRDPAGRAVRADMTPLYEYRDINQSVLAGITREAVGWLDPAEPTLMDIAFGLPVVMGPEAMRSETIGGVTVTYPGFETEGAPLFDLVYGVGDLLHRPETDDALLLTEMLFESHESEVAAMIEAGLRGDAVADVTDASLTEDSELWDDVIQVAQWIAQEPGLLEELLRALADPRSKRLGTVYAELMRFRDETGFDPTDLNRPMRDQVWTNEVDRSAPDTRGNISLFQQSVAIIHDLEGVRVCNKDGAVLRIDLGLITARWPLFGGADECELIEINNVAEAYAQSIIGRYELDIKDGALSFLLDVGSGLGIDADAVLERSSGIDGLTRRPTPEAMNRLVFAMEGNDFLEDVFDPPPTRDGVPIVEQHEPIIFGWERAFRFCGDELVSPTAPCATPEEITFYEAMSPLLEAFDSVDRRTEGRFLFSELITALHLHWPSRGSDTSQSADPAGDFYAAQSDGRSYEPIVSATFGDCLWTGSGAGRRCDPAEAGQLISRLHELAVTLDAVEVRPGVDGIDVLAAATEQLIDPLRNDGLRDRRGNAMTATNGGTPIPQTPLHLLLDPLSDFDDAFDARPERKARWRGARSTIVDQLLTIRSGAAGPEMANRRSYGLIDELVPFIREQIDAHERQGDLVNWGRSLAPRVEASLGSAIGASAIRLAEAINEDEAAEAEVSALTQYLVNEASGNDAFDTTVLATADLLQLLDDDTNLDPLMRALSEGAVPGIRDQVAVGGAITTHELSVEGSALDETLRLLSEMVDVDDRETLPVILANLVSLPETGSAETPLETIIDVTAEVHRVEANVGGPLRADDHRRVLTTATDFLLDEDRGLERIYDVIQSRQLEE